MNRLKMLWQLNEADRSAWEIRTKALHDLIESRSDLCWKIVLWQPTEGGKFQEKPHLRVNYVPA